MNKELTNTAAVNLKKEVVSLARAAAFKISDRGLADLTRAQWANIYEAAVSDILPTIGEVKFQAKHYGRSDADALWTYIEGII